VIFFNIHITFTPLLISCGDWPRLGRGEERRRRFVLGSRVGARTVLFGLSSRRQLFLSLSLSLSLARLWLAAEVAGICRTCNLGIYCEEIIWHLFVSFRGVTAAWPGVM
jgi:hypothetical protein